MPVALGDILEVKVVMSMGDQAGVNVHHFKVASVVAPIPPDEDLCQGFDTWLAPLYKPLINGRASWQGVRMQKIYPLPVTAAFTSQINVGAGTGDIAPLPAAVSGIVTWLSVLAGRSFRGRSYVPFPSETYNDDVTGRPTQAYTTGLDNLAASILGLKTFAIAGGSVEVQKVIWSRKLQVPTVPVSYRVNRKWATQHTRGDYGRPNAFPGL